MYSYEKEKVTKLLERALLIQAFETENRSHDDANDAYWSYICVSI